MYFNFILNIVFEKVMDTIFTQLSETEFIFESVPPPDKGGFKGMDAARKR